MCKKYKWRHPLYKSVFDKIISALISSEKSYPFVCLRVFNEKFSELVSRYP